MTIEHYIDGSREVDNDSHILSKISDHDLRTKLERCLTGGQLPEEIRVRLGFVDGSPKEIVERLERENGNFRGRLVNAVDNFLHGVAESHKPEPQEILDARKQWFTDKGKNPDTYLPM
jgi:hypothetical protein